MDTTIAVQSKKLRLVNNSVWDLFYPNRPITKTLWMLTLSCHLSLLILLWGVSPFELMPRPGEVYDSWIRLIREEGLLYELMVSLSTNLESIAISAILSLALAYLTVLPVMRPITMFLSKARFFGLTGFTILFTILFGGGHGLKVSLLVFGMSVFYLTSMSAIVASVPKDELDYARTLRMGEWRVVWEVIILGRIDQALEALRQNAAMGWVMLTMVEGISRAEGGVGTVLLNQNKHFKLAAVFGIQLTIFFVGICQDQLLGLFRKIVCPYADLTLERK